MNTSEYLRLISIPVVSALIGWLTNYIAVKMLFRPRKPWGIFKIQGLLPKRQKELALRVGETVEEKLLSMKDVIAHLNEVEINEKIAPFINETIDNFVTKQVQQIPMLSMFLQGEMLVQVKELLIKETMHTIPKIVGSLADTLEDKISFKKIVQERVEQFDLGVLEEIVYSISGSELKAIELLGGVLGFIIGIFQVGILFL